LAGAIGLRVGWVERSETHPLAPRAAIVNNNEITMERHVGDPTQPAESTAKSIIFPGAECCK
jgi:hypothetical protein